MAIETYQGTTNPGGSNSGWECRYVTHFCDATGMQYRVEIIDSLLTQTDFNWTRDVPKEFVCGSDGFTLTHEGSPDNLHQSIIASSLTLDFLVQNADDEKLFTALTSTTDHRFGIVVYKSTYFPNSTEDVPVGKWILEWCGVINPEGVSLELGESAKFLRLDAIDGLALLNDIPYLKDDGSLYDSWENLKGVIAQCIRHIPTASIWGFVNGSSASNVDSSTGSALIADQPPFFIETIHQWDSVAHDIGPVEGYASVIGNTGCQTQSFYSITRSEDRFGGNIKDTASISCSEVLDHVASLLRARIFLSDGSFQFQNPAAMVSNLTNINIIRWPTLYRMDFAGFDYLANTKAHRSDINTLGFEAINGADDSFLHPIKTATSIHENGGSSSLFGQLGQTSGNFQSIYNNTGTIDHAFNTHANTTAIMTEGQTLHMSGNIRVTCNNLSINAVDNFPDHVGAKVVLEFRIKCGNYYLKGNVANSSGTANIHRDLASDITYRSIVRSGDVEWTTAASSYFIVVPNHLCQSFPPIATIGSTEYVGGFNVTMNGNSTTEFKYSSGFFGGDGTNDPEKTFDINWTLPPLPAGTHTGASLSYAMKLYDAGGSQVTDDESSLSNLSAFNNHTTGSMVRFQNLHLNSGSPGADVDTQYSATQDANSVSMIASSSILGNQINDAWLGTLSVQDADNLGNYSASGEVWSSTQNPTAVMNIHKLNALECLQERGKSLQTRRCTLAFGRQYSGTPHILSDIIDIPKFCNSFKFNSEPLAPQFIPTSLTWTASPATIDFNGFLSFIQSGIVPIYDDTIADDLFDPPIGPSSEFDQTIQGISVGGVFPYQVAAINDSVKTNTTAIATNTAAISTNTTAIAAAAADDAARQALYLKIMPSEFMGNDDAPSRGGFEGLVIEDDTSSKLGVRISQVSIEMFVMKSIPKGYKATHVHVFTSSVVINGVDVYLYNHTTGVIVSKGSGNTGTNLDITDITSAENDNICIKVSPSSETIIIYGATITIAEI